MLAAMWGSVFSSTRMATELVGVAWKNNLVKLDVNNLKKFLPGEVLLQEVEVMVVEEVVRGQRVLPRLSPTLSLERGGLRLAAWEGGRLRKVDSRLI